MNMRIRTIQKAYEEIVAADPQTGITEYRIRQIVVDGVIPSRKVGAKYLFDLDVLLNYLSGDGGNK